MQDSPPTPSRWKYAVAAVAAAVFGASAWLGVGANPSGANAASQTPPASQYQDAADTATRPAQSTDGDDCPKEGSGNGAQGGSSGAQGEATPAPTTTPQADL